MTFEIRKGNWCDLPQVMGVVNACIQKLRFENIMQWDEIYPNIGVFEADIQSNTLFVTECGNEIVGFVALDFDQPTEYQRVTWRYPGKMMVVHRLGVDPRWYRQGIASTLMSFAEHSAIEQECTGLRLDAYSKNSSAVRLYARRKYRLAGQVFFPRRLHPFYCFEKNLAGLLK